ncbi:MAG TPA: ATP-binding protein [Firmicutes bacterium]|nr:ATP-binding protein [Bacillota bacterium]
MSGQVAESVQTSTTRSVSDGTTLSSGHTVSKTGSAMLLSSSGSEATTEGSSSSKGHSDTTSTTRNLNHTGYGELDRALELRARRIRNAAVEGGWGVAILFGSNDEWTAQRLGSTIVGALSGDSEPTFAPCWRWDFSLGSLIGHPRIPQGMYHRWPEPPFTFMTSRELALVLAPPVREVPGLEIVPTPRFGLQPRTGAIGLGSILDRGISLTSTQFCVSERDLLRHSLVVGMTGSGKTNTVFNILSQLKVPFLVVEPVKTEYRAILGLRPDVRIYTLGEERVSPMRLNPFWFPVGVSLQHHVDSLKALISSSFAMYASMPNILEQCLYSIYARKGWSLQTSTNVFADDAQRRAIFFPTLSDLYHEVAMYLDNSGYSGEAHDNIKSAMLTRLKSLMTGGKGLLLDTVEITDMDELLSHPTILELDGIPEDDDKALVMGLIMLNLYEHLKMKQSFQSESLRHLLILEEAHRVFQNVPSSNNPEIADPRGKMVEMLSNMLAEIRAYGQGVMIVDQVPLKLAPDAVKNTNLKIVHRLVSGDDCRYMSTALCVEPEESLHCSRLRRGESLVFVEGLNRPCQVQIRSVKSDLPRQEAKDVREAATAYNPLASDGSYDESVADALFQDPDIRPQVLYLATRLRRSYLFDDPTNFHTAWLEAKRQAIGIIEEAGYDVAFRDPASFAMSLMKIGLTESVQLNPYVGKNLRARSFLCRYMECALETSTTPFSEAEKGTCQLGVTRDYELHELLRHVYTAVFRTTQLECLGSVLPYSSVDADAVDLCIGYRRQRQPLPLASKAESAESLLKTLGDYVTRQFVVPPANSRYISLLVFKIAVLRQKGKVSPKWSHNVRRILGLMEVC